jgi:vancomycin resistance protein YoaR
VDLPVITGAPKVSSKDVGSLGIKELIGTGNTSFKGSTEARATNIKVAAGYLNGVVVPPGDTFSFLDAVAPITLDRGYVEGYVIAAERTQKGVGGGVCQVSTTVFRAAFFSAVDITERHQHAYRVSWYESKGEPVGFDAAVFDPGVDFKFVNNTPGYLLVQTDLTADELNVNFYGTKIADEVKLVGPKVANIKDPPQDIYQLDPTLPSGGKKQVETAHKGLDTTITRQVIKNGQVVSTDDFFSRFEAWPNWFMVASDVPTPYPPRPPSPPPGQ